MAVAFLMGFLGVVSFVLTLSAFGGIQQGASFRDAAPRIVFALLFAGGLALLRIFAY